MTCWTDGDLRAYADRELPAEDRDRLAEHLAGCGACDARYREIAARAERVAGALAGLTEGVVPGRRSAPAAGAARWWPRWAAAVGMAAGVALLLVSPRVITPRPAPSRPMASLDKGEFVALDNEPIDAGLVVRVSVGPNQVQADVIFTADGRARAYRLVKDQTTN
jgi:anti-sigma factor RsiW